MVQEEIRKGPWTEQEDLQLVCFVGLFGDRRWDFIAKVSGLKRTGKSCRLRWVNYLHPGLKRGKMTPHEEKLVLELHSQWGNSTVVPDTSALQGKKYQKDESGEEEIYSMDDIWKDITSEEPIKPVLDGYREGSNFSCSPMVSPLWEYCPDTLWRMDVDECKMFSPPDQFVPSCQQKNMSLTG
uniref:Uncharacterized protein n=1 Tax=Chenopodium quinoa TaxID=63459 RepID=A0A803KS31_CHEQI